MVDAPCGVAGFYTENGESKSAVLAAGAGSSVYIFKNLRPFFKYCLPHLEAHPKEREVRLRLKLYTFPVPLILFALHDIPELSSDMA